MERKVKYLEKELVKVRRVLQELGASKEVIQRTVVSFGNGGHVVIPKKYLNKNVKIIIE